LKYTFSRFVGRRFQLPRLNSSDIVLWIKATDPAEEYVDLTINACREHDPVRPATSRIGRFKRVKPAK